MTYKFNNLTKEELILLLEDVISKKEKQRISTSKYLHDRQEYRLFHACKQNAKKKGIEFSISLEDIIIPEFCPLTGVRITNIFGRGRVPTNASIDRKNSSLGYTKENIWVISDLANRMKQNATEEELVMFAKGIISYYERKNARIIPD